MVEVCNFAYAKTVCRQWSDPEGTSALRTSWTRTVWSHLCTRTSMATGTRPRRTTTRWRIAKGEPDGIIATFPLTVSETKQMLVHVLTTKGYLARSERLVKISKQAHTARSGILIPSQRGKMVIGRYAMTSSPPPSLSAVRPAGSATPSCAPTWARTIANGTSSASR